MAARFVESEQKRHQQSTSHQNTERGETRCVIFFMQIRLATRMAAEHQTVIQRNANYEHTDTPAYAAEHALFAVEFGMIA